jgi:hypothetical protein
VYGRQYGDRELRFEASGGLLHSALVMQDKETDSYWSIMTGTALAGTYGGTRLQELPLGEKARFRDWVKRHPQTLVLSVDGVEHVESNPYDNYFASEKGFHSMKAKDERLPTKAPIYAFWHSGKAFAVPFASFEGDGATFSAPGLNLFLERPRKADFYEATRAFRSTRGFERRDGAWVDLDTGARYDAGARRFVGGDVASEPLSGFDTFWYTWSLTNPGTELLGR